MKNTTELQRAIQRFLFDRSHSLVVTLKFDFAYLHKISPTMMRSTLREWDARVNRQLLGPNWTRNPAQHMSWDAFAEKIDTHAHYHVLVDMPAEDMRRFRIAGEKTWKSLRGTDSSDKGFHADVIYDKYGLVRYVTKEFNGLSHINSLELK